MADKIMSVHSIASAAAGWRRLRDNAPVACFALVTTANPESMSVTELMVVPLVEGDLGQGLIGKAVDLVDDEIKFYSPSQDAEHHVAD